MTEICVIWLALPDGKVALQRRDKNTNISAGLLSLFGGHVEAGETPDEAMRRELAEETSLNVPSLNISRVTNVELPHPNDPAITRMVYIYRTAIDSDDFEVFEGEGSETYSIADLKERQDLGSSLMYVMVHFKDLHLGSLV